MVLKRVVSNCKAYNMRNTKSRNAFKTKDKLLAVSNISTNGTFIKGYSPSTFTSEILNVYKIHYRNSCDPGRILYVAYSHDGDVFV